MVHKHHTFVTLDSVSAILPPRRRAVSTATGVWGEGGEPHRRDAPPSRIINYEHQFGHQKQILFGSPGRTQNGALRRRPKLTIIASMFNKHSTFDTFDHVLAILSPRPLARFCFRFRPQSAFQNASQDAPKWEHASDLQNGRTRVPWFINTTLLSH